MVYIQDIEIVRGDDSTWTLTAIEEIKSYYITEFKIAARKESLTLFDYIQKYWSTLVAAGKIVISDITDCTLILTVRRQNSTVILIQKTTDVDDGIVLTDPTNGVAEITVDSADTETLRNLDYNYIYDVQITKPTGKIETLVKGAFKLISEVTHDDTVVEDV
jgi:hypothetical protein